MTLTYAEARDLFLVRVALAPRTKDIYARAIGHFLDYVAFAPCPPLHELGQRDADILAQFALWLLDGCEAITETSTAKAYAAGVVRWFRWLADYGELPPSFPFNKARRLLREALRSSLFRSSTRPPEPPAGIEELIVFYDALAMPQNLKAPDAQARWRLTNLRNRALMRVLAETGGRISEIVSLNVADFPPRVLQGGAVARVWVRGKAGRDYPLRFLKSLPHIEAYLDMRTAVYGTDPYPALFIRHTPAGKGQRMTRNDAWRVVTQAGRALGLGRVHPHDFRHWSATELVRQGVPLEIVKEYLGHRSIQTTETFYAHIGQEQVDDVVRKLL